MELLRQHYHYRRMLSNGSKQNGELGNKKRRKIIVYCAFFATDSKDIASRNKIRLK